MILVIALLLLADDPYQFREGHAPTPFSAEDIRKGCPEGRESTFSIKAPGRKAAEQTFAFGKGTETNTALTVTGMGRKNEVNVAWRALQGHASFPKDQTKITDGKITVPAGTFHCKVYTVTLEAAGVKTVRTFWFAKNLAGPPVKQVQTVAGKEQMTMTLVRHRMGDEQKILKTLGGDAAVKQSKPSFADGDADKDGKLSHEEWKKISPDADDFHRADADHDNAVSEKEWNTYVKADVVSGLAFDEHVADGKFKSEKHAHLLPRFDFNADGKLTRDEFCRVWIEWACSP